MSEQINVIAAMTLAARLLDAHHPGHKSPAAAKLDEARETVTDLIAASQQVRSQLRSSLMLLKCDDEFIDSQTAELDAVLARIGAKP